MIYIKKSVLDSRSTGFFYSINISNLGGVCWVKIMEGKCKEPIQRNISKENCCSAGPNVGFTEKELNDFEYFFATAIGDGSTCTSCIGNQNKN